MPVFQYEAVLDGRRTRGCITADTSAQGRSLLRNRSMRLLSFRAAKSSRPDATFRLPCLSKTKREEAVDEFTHYLAMLLGAGIPLADALDLLVRQLPRRIEPAVRRVCERVKAGSDFAAALTDEPTLFDQTYVGIVRVGQASGMLEKCLERLVQLRRRSHLFRQRVRAMMAYPAIVCCAGILVVVFLMTFVIPRIRGILEHMGKSLPLPTQILLGLSDAISGYWWFMAAGAIGVAVLVRCTGQTERVNIWFRRTLRRIPILGSLLTKAAIAQFASLLETMLQSGLPLDESLAIIQNATQDPLLQAEVGRMLESIRSGRPMVDPAQKKSTFPPAVVHVLSVGDVTGQLDQMLGELARFYDVEVDIASKRAVSMIEPIVIIVMCCIVGFIVLATLLPILRVTGSL